MSAGIARGAYRVEDQRTTGSGNATLDDLPQQLRFHSQATLNLLAQLWNQAWPQAFCIGEEVKTSGNGSCDLVFIVFGRPLLQALLECADECANKHLAPTCTGYARAEMPARVLPRVTPETANSARVQRRRRRSSGAWTTGTEQTANSSGCFEHAIAMASARDAVPCLGTTCSSFCAPMTRECAAISQLLATHVHGCATITVVVRSGPGPAHGTLPFVCGTCTGTCQWHSC